MGDFGFALLRSSSSSSSSSAFDSSAAAAFRSCARPSPGASPPLPLLRRTMQDELLRAVRSARQSPPQESPPPAGDGAPQRAPQPDCERLDGSARQHPPQGERQQSFAVGGPVRLDPASPEDPVAPSPSRSPVSPSQVAVPMDPPAAVGAGFVPLPNADAHGPASPPLPGFGTPWSVQTSPPPPPVSGCGSEPDGSALYPGLPGSSSSCSSSASPAFFQGFSAVPGFGGPFSPQVGGVGVPQPPPPQSRRSPVSAHVQQAQQQQGVFPQHRSAYSPQQPMMKQSPWSSHQGGAWSSAGLSWGGLHGRDHRRATALGVPGALTQISPMKKPFSSSVIAPPKFPRSSAAVASLGPKSWMDDNMFRTDSNSNSLLPLQDRTRMYDSLNMQSLESSLIDIVRADQDPVKGRMGFPLQGTDNLLVLNGRSSLFPIDDGLLDDGHGNQGVTGVLSSPNCYSHQNGERVERFSRKVFVGGLPPDIDEDEITSSFRRFGHLVVDWPHKAESKSYFPPKGYAFLLFQEESSVQALIEACLEEDSKLYLCVSSPTIKDKPVQIRPWNLSDSDFVMDGSQPLDPRKTIFVGGVPRPLRAVELAMIMDRLYGGVCYAGIDTDPELKYPKGAGRVAFSNQQSYIAAISARFVQLQHGDIDKRVEVKPYVLDDQLCDECQGARCGGKFAPFFCANVTCLQYYCEFCWANIHSRAGREFHKPLVKEGADRPRQVHFRWN
ncbi:cytoplasmic polyadenylation element-binding protein 2 isoform X2 [Arapaima gigas]